MGDKAIKAIDADEEEATLQQDKKNKYLKLTSTLYVPVFLDLYSSNANTDPYSGIVWSFCTLATSIRAPMLKSWPEIRRSGWATGFPQMKSFPACTNMFRRIPGEREER